MYIHCICVNVCTYVSDVHLPILCCLRYGHTTVLCDLICHRTYEEHEENNIKESSLVFPALAVKVPGVDKLIFAEYR